MRNGRVSDEKEIECRSLTAGRSNPLLSSRVSSQANLMLGLSNVVVTNVIGPREQNVVLLTVTGRAARKYRRSLQCVRPAKQDLAFRLHGQPKLYRGAILGLA